MLDLSGPAALEVVHVAVAGESKGVPEADRGLHPKFVLKSPKWRSSVESPVAPGGASQPVLEEHPDDRHHGKATIGKFCIQFPLLDLRIIRGNELETVVAGTRGSFLLGQFAIAS